MKINKDLIYKYTDYTTLRGLGAGWIAEFKGYLPIGDWIQKASLYQVALWAMHLNWIQFWMIITFIAVKFYLMILFNWIVGRYVIKSGVLEAQQNYGAKKESLSPYNREVIKTMENICKAVKAESAFTKL